MVIDKGVNSPMFLTDLQAVLDPQGINAVSALKLPKEGNACMIQFNTIPEVAKFKNIYNAKTIKLSSVESFTFNSYGSYLPQTFTEVIFSNPGK